jgi:hypothetical protein
MPSSSSNSTSSRRTRRVPRDSIPPPIMQLSSNDFSDMILYTDYHQRLATAFCDDPSMTIGLRYYTFLAETIVQLKEELQRHTIEQQDMFGRMIRNRRFQKRITPIVAEYRRQYRMRNATPPISSSSSDDASPRTFLTARDSIPGSPTKLIDDNERDPSHIPEFTPVLEPPISGTSSYPIDVDNLPCQRCKELGHEQENCTTQILLPTCERCGQYGHEKPDCDTKIRSFVFLRYL